MVRLVKCSCTPAFLILVPLGIGSCTTGLAVVVFVKVTSCSFIVLVLVLEKESFEPLPLGCEAVGKIFLNPFKLF